MINRYIIHIKIKIYSLFLQSRLGNSKMLFNKFKIRNKLVLMYLLRKRRASLKRKFRRKYWIHPILRDRSLHGMYFTLFPELRNNPGKFYNYFRMSIENFDYLVSKLKPKIKKRNTLMRSSVSAEERLVITLRYTVYINIIICGPGVSVISVI